MKPENKELLLKDLCARLFYSPFVQLWEKFDDEDSEYFREIHNLSTYDIELFNSGEISNIKPYLRPMSSMTEEEKKEYIEYAGYEIEESVNGRHYEYYLKDFCGTPDNPSVNTNGVDWLNKKMFDYRGLIPKDLAISTEVFNPYNKD